MSPIRRPSVPPCRPRGSAWAASTLWSTMRVLQGRIQELAGLFWIEALDQLGGALEVGKEHRYLLALAFQGSARGEDFFGQIRRGVRQWGALLVTDERRGHRRIPGPDQHSASLVHGELFGLDDFSFEVFEVVLVEVEAALERPIRHPPVAPQQVKHPGQDLVKRHACLLPLGAGAAGHGPVVCWSGLASTRAAQEATAVCPITGSLTPEGGSGREPGFRS